MNARNGSLAASVVNRPGPAFASNRAIGESVPEERRAATVADAANHPSEPFIEPSDALPSNDFLKEMQREKRRSERSNASLSLAIYRVDNSSMTSAAKADQLLEILHGAKRETDTLGHVGDGMIAMLCPDTDAAGIQGFLRKIEDMSGDLSFEVVAATYPDQLFESLANSTPAAPALQRFLAADAPKSGRKGYPLKRVLDVAGALLALLLLGPLMLVVAGVIALTSRGPVIFRQQRLGAGGVPFTFYKFRSMVTNADDGVHRAFVANLISGSQNPAPGGNAGTAPYKLQADPRITPIGRFIRRTSIDELPQFFNVLKGEMSLVGPRPCLPYEAVHYQTWHLRRILSIKPGITGLWQVDGRSKVTFNEMVRMDLRYLRDCSLGLDLKLLLKTVLVVLRCDGAV